MDRPLGAVPRSLATVKADFHATLLLAFIGLSLGVPAIIYLQF